jgi:hypothetical protein
MKRKFLLGGILAVIVSIAIIAGCAIEKPAGDEEAIVEITINQDMFTAKTIVPPDITMKIDRYVLKWWLTTAPGTVDSKNVTPVGPSTTVYLLLAPGEYKFEVEGWNDTDTGADYPIGKGSSPPVTLVPKIQQPINITIEPVIGSGNYSITVNWTQVDYDFGGTLYVDIWEKDATNFDKVTNSTQWLDQYSIEQPFTDATDPKLVTLSKSDLQNGYYKCIITMTNDTDTRLWSTIDALRIVSDYTSEETYTLKRQLDALVAVNITEDLQNPLKIDLWVVDKDGTAGPHGNGWWYSTDDLPEFFMITNTPNTNLDVWAYPVDAATNLSPTVDKFEWYLDVLNMLTPVEEVLISTGTNVHESYSRVTQAGNGLNVGSYSLSVLIYKGDTVSSRGFQFIVE